MRIALLALLLQACTSVPCSMVETTQERKAHETEMLDDIRQCHAVNPAAVFLTTPVGLVIFAAVQYKLGKLEAEEIETRQLNAIKRQNGGNNEKHTASANPSRVHDH